MLTPSQNAAWLGHLEIAKFLLRQGADTTVTDIKLRYAYMSSAEFPLLTCLQQGITSGKIPLNDERCNR